MTNMDLVINGLDLFNVETLSETPVKMIERHYGKLQEETAAAALAELDR